MSLEAAVTAHMNAVAEGTVLVRNDGAFVARFSISYEIKGIPFSNSSGDITVGVNKSVTIPAGSTNINLKVEEMWGFGWSTIFTKQFSAPVTQCYKVFGTTLNPGYEEIDC